ncbi:hypothetical protein AAT19DRAFT_16489 [Rhodotorula toruloides]|uniref:Uncharacterized protein n=1 Tax=Rhodotorula toruloides TaxID=5286 RepID=A0A2T0A3J3_RHOTO|nr:hypothetical protein AAT19DRAFT_16489 [Rhodotorula toruloides]
MRVGRAGEAASRARCERPEGVVAYCENLSRACASQREGCAKCGREEEREEERRGGEGPSYTRIASQAKCVTWNLKNRARMLYKSSPEGDGTELTGDGRERGGHEEALLLSVTSEAEERTTYLKSRTVGAESEAAGWKMTEGSKGEEGRKGTRTTAPGASRLSRSCKNESCEQVCATANLQSGAKQESEPCLSCGRARPGALAADTSCSRFLLSAAFAPTRYVLRYIPCCRSSTHTLTDLRSELR